MNNPKDKSCSVIYGPDCEDLSPRPGAEVENQDNSSSITIHVPNDLGDTKNVCFDITASNDKKTVNVAGVLYEATDTGNHNLINLSFLWIFCHDL